MRKSAYHCIPGFAICITIFFCAVSAFGQNSRIEINSAIRSFYMANYAYTSKLTTHFESSESMYNMPGLAFPAIMILQLPPDSIEKNFKIRISAIEQSGITVRVLNNSGKLLKRIAAKRDRLIIFGNDLKPGKYKMEIIQGQNRRVETLVKM